MELSLSSNYEEADTNMIFHVYTDVLVIMLGNMESVPEEMEVGTGKSQRSIHLNKLYETLGEKLCRTLPAFHAPRGCDLNPEFFR
ncbi:hypothetical protein FQA39_LY02391 [Lamprigera yunnana]|nr:hypothetical protein FQA39_LY02391 [Lamprigera yunnana]